MFYFITVFRALASILITNSHYAGIYPTDILASGGLAGDVLFFAISGFCLANITRGFAHWYSKRLLRIYPSVWIATAIFMAIGWYPFNASLGWIEYYLFPTTFHFIASIIVLYPLYYLVMRISVFKRNIIWVIGSVFAIQLVWYCGFYDMSYYHIDSVHEPMIRIFFLQAMLIGGQVRVRIEKIANLSERLIWTGLGISTLCYLVSKTLFSTGILPPFLQIANQVILLVLLSFLMLAFAVSESRLEHIPNQIKCVIGFLAPLTLEIYLVQYALIPLFRSSTIPFPLNWLALTAMIVFSAWVVHAISLWLVNLVSSGFTLNRKHDDT